MADDKKIIFSMVGVSKAFQANKQVLKDIYLSFFYGAKIGIIGLNGSGKSTLMKIIAGLEKSYQGEVVFSPGYSVGYLAQEPHLDDEKTVKEVVMEGVQSIVDTLAEYTPPAHRHRQRRPSVPGSPPCHRTVPAAGEPPRPGRRGRCPD